MLNSLSYIDSSFFYIDDLNILKANKNHINGGQFVVAPFSYTFTQDDETISGISYELYFIDENKNFNQLTYTFKEGNGLYIDDNLCVNLNIDNYSLVNNENDELTINEDSFDTAYYNTMGVLHASDDLYVNDILMQNINKIGSMYSDNGTLSLNKGLVTDLLEIKKYYENCISLSNEIEFMCKMIITKKTNFNVGDYLYKKSDGTITDEVVGDPYMVCVIASNVLDDGYARFTLVHSNDNVGRFAIEPNKIPIKKAYGNIPVYNKEYQNIINESEYVVGAKGGYFALEREDWVNNLVNKFNRKENFALPPYDSINSVFLDWYIDQYYVNNKELYKIDKSGVFSEAFNLVAGDHKVIVKSKVTFKDGFTGDYLFNLEYNNESKRYELTEDCLPIIEQNNNENNNEQNNDLSDGDHYYYSIDIISNIFDEEKVYLKCYLAKDENCTSFYEPEIVEYNNSKGLNKTFDILQTHNKGGIKILAYSSRYLLDINPYNFGLLKPSKTEIIGVSDDGRIRYLRKKISITINDTINLNINKYVPTKLSVVSHLNDEGETINEYYMLKTNGIINNGNYGLINLKYTFDCGYVIKNDNNSYFNKGCIKITRNDNYGFDFTQCQINVKIKVDLENEYYVYTLNMIFKINGNVLESEYFDMKNYKYDNIRSVEINKFEYISDAQSTTIDNYEFDNQANILNN